MKKILTFILALASTPVFSHSGHLMNESVHGFLHVEHIFVLIASALIAFVVYRKGK